MSRTEVPVYMLYDYDCAKVGAADRKASSTIDPSVSSGVSIYIHSHIRKVWDVVQSIPINIYHSTNIDDLDFYLIANCRSRLCIYFTLYFLFCGRGFKRSHIRNCPNGDKGQLKLWRMLQLYGDTEMSSLVLMLSCTNIDAVIQTHWCFYEVFVGSLESDIMFFFRQTKTVGSSIKTINTILVAG